MNITLTKLGAIDKATFDLSKKLIIFCGPNNSGKTYAAFIIYALTKSSLKYFRSSGKSEFLQELVKLQKTNYTIDSEAIWKYREKELNNIQNSLASLFGIPNEVQINLFENFTLTLNQTYTEFKANITEMEFNNELNLDHTRISIIKKRGDYKIQLAILDSQISKDKIEVLELFLVSKLFSLVAFYPFTSSHILPVERNSIYTFSKELSIQKQEFFDRAQELSSKSTTKDPFHWLARRSTRYPMPIRDGLEIAEDLENYSKFKTDFFDLAEEIEEELLQGKLILSKEGDMQFASKKAKSKKIPIHLAASIVKTLSSLVFYLKHIAVKNELIIIDEPELNLHPNNQVYLTRLFAKLINRGFKLLISTHSDYIIREVNNIIMASSNNSETQKIAEKLGYSSDIKLDKENVSAYYFHFPKSNSKSVSVLPLEISETGFEVKSIDTTIEDLNNTTESLFYSLKYTNE